MRTLDWIVLIASLVFVVAYGMYRGRNSDTTEKYLLAGKSMPWYAMALSIMATQASAITFISTTGQAYVDGMRFIQFYFGLPIAMVLISMTAVPIFHRAGVYTAYEYLEKRFDAKTRTLVSIVFLISRGLAVGVALYAPAIVLTVIFGWPDQWTTLIMGVMVLIYTVQGGIAAVTWTDFQQMLIMMVGLVVALFMAVWLLPADVSFLDAVSLAGAAGRLNAVVTTFDWNDRYNIWSGLLAGTFLYLAYFGTDQSQVQRFLTGKSIAQSRLSLLFNAVAKLPMQFVILFTGAMVFVFYTFTPPPVTFNAKERQEMQREGDFAAFSGQHSAAWEQRRQAARSYMANPTEEAATAFRDANNNLQATRRKTQSNDANYVFLTFVTQHLPAGFVGLVMAAIFAAAMSTISAEVNSLATVSVIDVYKRYVRRGADDKHYLRASQAFTAFWCGYAILTARYGAGLGSLIEAVNQLGSLFYSCMLGVFVLAFYFPRVTANGAFVGVLVGEAAIFATNWFTDVAYLWYNVIGGVVVIAVALIVSAFEKPKMLPAD
ncbi:MAG TPA: sodium:solute symporter [Bryobacteraceae bacterium]|nr:sodium:solute symporter [Bryobacteraceae bacterium]